MKKKSKIISPCDDKCPVRAIPGISEKMLIQELNMLVAHKLVTKKAYPEIPPRVEYRLTKLGLKTLPVVDKLAEFGLENLV